MKLQEIQQKARLFKSLAHSKRLEIITLLHGHQLTVNQIVQMTALRQSTVSQHLTELRSRHLVTSKRIGKEMYYSLRQDSIDMLSTFFNLLTHTRPLLDAEPSVTDPICKMSLTPSIANYTSEYDGVRHYFCGKGCYREFNILHKGQRET